MDVSAAPSTPLPGQLPVTASSPATAWLDAAGITVSITCAIHCAASALFLAALSLLGITNSLPEWLEWAFLATSVVIGTIALRNGRRSHGQKRPLQLFAVGVAILLAVRAAGLSSPRWETVGVVLGATTIIIAHAANWRHGKARRAGGCEGDRVARS